MSQTHALYKYGKSPVRFIVTHETSTADIVTDFGRKTEATDINTARARYHKLTDNGYTTENPDDYYTQQVSTTNGLGNFRYCKSEVTGRHRWWGTA